MYSTAPQVPFNNPLTPLWKLRTPFEETRTRVLQEITPIEVAQAIAEQYANELKELEARYRQLTERRDNVVSFLFRLGA